jgi:hypothetical protein
VRRPAALMLCRKIPWQCSALELAGRCARECVRKIVLYLLYGPVHTGIEAVQQAHVHLLAEPSIKGGPRPRDGHALNAP